MGQSNIICKVFLGQDTDRCKVQVYIYIYSLHLAPKLKHLYTEICVIKKCVVSLNP